MPKLSSVFSAHAQLFAEFAVLYKIGRSSINGILKLCYIYIKFICLLKQVVELTDHFAEFQKL